MIPVFVFTAALWSAYIVVAAGTLYLLAVLVHEWRAGALW